MTLPFGYDLERIVDDFVFMCFFVGNDFLPHMPTLEIREGAIELLMSLYKKILPSLDGYLTDNGEVHGARVKVLVTELGHLETGILQRRREKEEREKTQRANRDRYNTHPNKPRVDGQSNLKRSRDESDASSPPSKRIESSNQTPRTPNNPPRNSNNPNTPNTPNSPNAPEAPEAPKPEEDDDKVKLGTPGYRERYYSEKLHADLQDSNSIYGVCTAFIEGLSWVLRYYYQGCCSWKWYYPYHYAPFATDIARYLGNFKPTFSLGTPFKPFEQLMGVLPPASNKCVPKAYRYIMGVKSEDDQRESPIGHLYPTDFKLDKNGKRMLWQAVILLPFMEESELLTSLAGIENQLTVAEKNRNTLGEDLLFVNTHHPLAPVLVMAQELKDGTCKIFIQSADYCELTLQLGETTALSFAQGLLTGLVKKYGPLQRAHFGDVIDLSPNVVGAVFQNPAFPEGYVHESRLLEGFVSDEKVLDKGIKKRKREKDKMIC